MAFTSHLLSKPTETLTPAEARKAMRDGMKLGPSGSRAKLTSVEDIELGGVRVRRYLPLASKPGTLVYFHGGGWMLGDLDTHDVLCSHLSAQTHREVVSVQYRLAPEHPWPAAVDDCLAVTNAVLAKKAGKVVVAGDSAGGNLAAVVSQRLVGRLAAQLLIYPVIDGVEERQSYSDYATDHLLTREAMRYFWRSYVPDAAKRSDPACSPIRATSVKGQPPSYFLLSQCDVLHDEGVAYAEFLRAAAVEVAVDEVPGTIHGFMSMLGLGVSRDALSRAVRWLEPKW